MTRSAYSPLTVDQVDEVTFCSVRHGAAEEGQSAIGMMLNNSYSCWRQVDFGAEGATGFEARVRIRARTGWIAIHLDSPNGPMIGRCLVTKREVGDGWATVRTGVYDATGVHDVVLVFTGMTTMTMELAWWRCTADVPWAGDSWGMLCLPPQVPYLGPPETSFFGNGLVGAGGSPDGVWDYLIGPRYSMNSFIDSSEIGLVVDGVQYPLGVGMRRARGTGMLFATQEIAGIRVWLVDFCIPGEPVAVRAVRVENSGDETHHVAVTAHVNPACQRTRAWQQQGNVLHHLLPAGGLLLIQEERDAATIAMAGPESAVIETGDGIVLTSTAHPLAPGGVMVRGLYHRVHAAGEGGETNREWIARRDPVADLCDCLEDWAAWTRRGRPLEFIADARARDIVEGTAVSIRMQQGADGGIMATPRTYPTCYTRDTHAALTGMIAAVHTEEARAYLLWMERIFERLMNAGQFAIPNAADIGGDGYFAGFGDAANWAAESPALYLLVADAYWQATGDLATLEAVAGSLDYAMQVQLDYAEQHDWRLLFNGDETDSYGSLIQLEDWGGHWERHAWSMPSVALCGRALDFYLRWCRAADRAVDYPGLEAHARALRVSLDRHFWRDALGLYDWYRGQDGAWPTCRLSNYHLFPLYFQVPLDHPDRAVRTALHVKAFLNQRGFVPTQPLGNNNDFCGHNLGYLLHVLSRLADPLADTVYQSLILGGTVGCWGTWSESYDADGVSYGPEETWDCRQHNLRPFESGINIAALIAYWEKRR